MFSCFRFFESKNCNIGVAVVLYSCFLFAACKNHDIRATASLEIDIPLKTADIPVNYDVTIAAVVDLNLFYLNLNLFLFFYL